MNEFLGTVLAQAIWDLPIPFLGTDSPSQGQLGSSHLVLEALRARNIEPRDG